MLIYNTTFQVDDEIHDNFLIWIKECYIPEIKKHGALKSPRMCRVLSHREDGTSYSLQWEVESSGVLQCVASGTRCEVEWRIIENI